MDGFLDSDDERAIQDILSQAMDHSVLEQVAAINCSAFDSVSVLPTHLETRFHKLKSFPSTNLKSQFLKNRNDFASSSFNSRIPPSTESQKPQIGQNRIDSEHDSGAQSNERNDSPPPSKENPIGKNGEESKSPSGFCSSPPKLSDFSMENTFFSSTKQGNTKDKMRLKSEPRSGLFRSPSDSSNSSSESRSLSHKIGCFWCSPKRVSRKKIKENRIRGIELDWGNDDELLSDLNTFSSREQEQILKKAMKEQEKLIEKLRKLSSGQSKLL